MFIIEMICTLKGAPLAVLIVLALVRQSVGAQYLARITGHSDKPTQQALKLLLDYTFFTFLAISWMRSRSSSPAAPHPFVPSGILGRNCS